MTQFDLLVLGLIGLSALVGFVRGGVRELAAFAALIGAVIATLLLLPLTGPIFRAFVRPEWLGSTVAVVVTFLVLFVAFRVAAAAIATVVHATPIVGVLDRGLGLAIGVVRGLIVVGGLFLLFDAATPADLRPAWITEAKTWPLAQGSGAILRRITPEGVKLAGRLKPALDRAVGESSGDRTATEE